MVELVDTGDLKSPGHCDRAGSSPAPGTTETVFSRRLKMIYRFKVLLLGFSIHIFDGCLQQTARVTCYIMSFVFDASI